MLTVQSGIHPADIDQEADHGHVDGRRPLGQQLVLQDLAAFAALGHGIEVNVGKGVSRCSVRHLVEDAGLVIKDGLEKVVLNVLSPQRHAIFLLQVTNLVT